MFLPNYRRTTTTTLLFLVLLSAGQLAQAQSLRKQTSLAFAPARASFFVTMLRNGEQYERFSKSKAFAKLRDLPFVQEAIEKAKSEWQTNGDLSELREFLDKSVNQELLSLMCDAVSDEVFVYGDDRLAVWLSAMNRFGNASNMARLRALQSGEDPEQLMRSEMIKLINDTPGLLQAPTTVVGFRIGDGARAEKQIARLEEVLKAQLAAKTPQLVERLSREKIGDSSFLTFRLDGSLIPWADLLAGADIEADEATKLLDKLNKLQITFSLGVWREYVLWSVGEDNASIKALGTGELLADRREMKALAQAEGKKVTGVAFVDGEFLKRLSAVDQQIDQLTSVIKTVLPLAPIDPDLKDEIAKDADQFGQEVKAMIPEIGSVSSYAYMTETGSEGYTYNWSQRPQADGSKPLTILNHLGASPIAFAAGRAKKVPGQDEFGRKWMAKLAGYSERIAVPFLNGEQREMYDKVKQEMIPLLKQMDKASREKVAVAFADGQSAIVLDAKLTSTSWLAAMPPTETELPLPEVCLVRGVSDAKLLREGYAEIFDAMQTALTKLNEIAPDQVPPIQIPPPQIESSEAGTVYSYPMPPIAGADPRIAANAGVSDNAMVLSLVPNATKRLMKADELVLEDTLATTDRPLAGAWHFNTAAFVDMLRPWIAYGFETAASEGAVDEDVREQINTVLDVISCLRACSGVSYVENGVLVSHQITRVKDLD